jgi:hypothetical protein
VPGRRYQDRRPALNRWRALVRSAFARGRIQWPALNAVSTPRLRLSRRSTARGRSRQEQAVPATNGSGPNGQTAETCQDCETAMSRSRTAWPPRRRLQECLEFRQRGRVLEQEQVPSFVAAQLGSADARCDRGAVLDRRDPVIVAVPDQGRAGDRVEAVPDVMARACLELGRAGGCGGRIPLIVADGGQAVGQRAIGGVCLQPTLVPAAVRQLELRAARCSGGSSCSFCSG